MPFTTHSEGGSEERPETTHHRQRDKVDSILPFSTFLKNIERKTLAE
jgi:hypothetical protein